MAPRKKAAASTDPGVIQVRSLVDHTEPGTQIYRTAGEVFQHAGDPYKHVELDESTVEDDDEEG